MEKRAETDYPIDELLARRWSPRAFGDRPLSRDQICRLFEAARWAPSSYNEQPWHFLIATRDHPVEFERMLRCLTDGNQVWARRAPLLMLSVAALSFSDTGKPNRHAFHDIGLAVENLVIQATSMGLVAHQMAGIHVDRIRTEYELPEGYDPVTAVAVGYPGDPAVLPDTLRQRELAPRSRRPITDFVFSQWRRISPLVTKP